MSVGLIVAQFITENTPLRRWTVHTEWKCTITETYIIYWEHMRIAHVSILKIVLQLRQSPQKTDSNTAFPTKR